jgi:hypothetical protein
VTLLPKVMNDGASGVAATFPSDQDDQRTDHDRQHHDLRRSRAESDRCWGEVDARFNSMPKAKELTTALGGLATQEHVRLLALLIPLHQLILRSGAFFPPVAFDCLGLPPARCVANHRDCDIEEAEAELCCGHDLAFPNAALGVLSAQR